MRMWYKSAGKDSDVVVSTRVRLARNAVKIPFPPAWSDSAAKEITDNVKHALDTTGHKFSFLNLDNAPQENKSVLVEDHILSREMLGGKNKALFLDEAGEAAVLVGEEDHLRIQVITPGLDLREAYAKADALDTAISGQVEYAFDETFGYLTHCPTNVGTGMRASVMLHLPALRMAGSINSIVSQVAKLGLTIRGVYGEGSGTRGDMYQLSNQITLGLSEEKTVEKLAEIVERIMQLEREMREKLYAKDEHTFADLLWRAYGTLKYARKISSEEAQKLLSSVKLGADMGILENVDRQKLIQLMIESEPHHVALASGEAPDATARDIARATAIRAAL